MLTLKQVMDVTFGRQGGCISGCTYGDICSRQHGHVANACLYSQLFCEMLLLSAWDEISCRMQAAGDELHVTSFASADPSGNIEMRKLAITADAITLPQVSSNVFTARSSLYYIQASSCQDTVRHILPVQWDIIILEMLGVLGTGGQRCGDRPAQPAQPGQPADRQRGGVA